MVNSTTPLPVLLAHLQANTDQGLSFEQANARIAQVGQNVGIGGEEESWGRLARFMIAVFDLLKTPSVLIILILVSLTLYEERWSKPASIYTIIIGAWFLLLLVSDRMRS